MNVAFGGPCIDHCEECHLLRCNSLQCDFACWLLFADYLLGLLFNTEDGDSVFLRNVCELLPDYTASHPRSVRSTDIRDGSVLPIYNLCVIVNIRPSSEFTIETSSVV
jgi:hypothetical protein